MATQETARLILGLRYKGWTDTEIAGFLLWIESGDDLMRRRNRDNPKQGKAFCLSLFFMPHPLAMLCEECYNNGWYKLRQHVKIIQTFY